MKLEIDTMIGIPEAARMIGEPERTLRDRLTKLDARLRSEGKRGVLLRYGSRSWSVRLEALRDELRSPASEEPGSGLGIRVEEIDARLCALRDSHRKLRDSHEAEKRRQARRWDAQVRVNDGLRAAAEAMKELEHD
jgi:hypothetical protein